MDKEKINESKDMIIKINKKLNIQKRNIKQVSSSNKITLITLIATTIVFVLYFIRYPSLVKDILEDSTNYNVNRDVEKKYG